MAEDEPGRQGRGAPDGAAPGHGPLGTAPDHVSPGPAPRRGPALGDLLMALAVLALGGYFLWGASNIRVIGGYDRIGPRFFPYLVAAGLLACGLLLLVQALRGESAPLEEAEEVDVRAPVNWRAVLVISAALLLDVLLLERLGFVLGSALLFWGVALGFGSRRYLRDVLSGLALALASYLTFTRLLDLDLPAGVLPFLLLAAGG